MFILKPLLVDLHNNGGQKLYGMNLWTLALNCIVFHRKFDRPCNKARTIERVHKLQ